MLEERTPPEGAEPDDEAPVSVQHLLDEGLERHAKNAGSDAAHFWLRALTLSSDVGSNLDEVEVHGSAPAPISALRPIAMPGAPAVSMVSTVSIDPVAREAAEPVAATGTSREVLIDLLRERRFEEALLWLRVEQRQWPDDLAIRRGIGHLEDHLAARYERALGDLDRVVRVQASSAALRTLSAERQRLLRRVDGFATLREVIAFSPLGPYETRRLLAEMVEKAVLGVAKSTPPPPRDAEPRTVSDVAPRTSRPAPRVDEGDELFDRATEAYLSGRHDEAIALYERCLAICPTHAQAALNLAALRRRAERSASVRPGETRS